MLRFMECVELMVITALETPILYFSLVASWLEQSINCQTLECFPMASTIQASVQGRIVYILMLKQGSALSAWWPKLLCCVLY